MLKKKKLASAKTGPLGGDIGTIVSTKDADAGLPSTNSAGGKLSVMTALKSAKKKGVTQAQKENFTGKVGALTEDDIAGMKDADSPARKQYLEKMKKRLK